MHLLSLPRHRIETTFGEYARIIASLAGPREAPGSIARFERRFAEYIGCRHAIAVSSGRLGMHLILNRLGITPGDEAIIPAFNLFAVVERFRQFGLVPRFCDVREEDLNLDVRRIDPCCTPRTRIVLATHMFGHPVDMEPLADYADRHDLVLLEDCAHALGTRYRGRFTGTFGRASIFSFSVLKLVTTFGGGMIATNDDELAAGLRADLARIHHRRPRTIGLKRALTGAIMDCATRRFPFSFGAWPVLRLLRAGRPDFQQKIMTERPHAINDFDPSLVPLMHPFQATLGRSQLTRVERLIEARSQIARWLNEELRGIPQLTRLMPSEASRPNRLYYGVLADQPAELSRYLFQRGIDTETSEYLNCAELELYRDYGTDCPVAHKVQSRILRLPNYPAVSQRDVRRIGKAIRAFYAQG